MHKWMYLVMIKQNVRKLHGLVFNKTLLSIDIFIKCSMFLNHAIRRSSSLNCAVLKGKCLLRIMGDL